MPKSIDSKLPVVLVLAPYYLPGFKGGGPIRSIANMVQQLGLEYDFRIITTDRDLGDSTPYAGIDSNRWIQSDRAWVYYISPDSLRKLRLVSVVNSVNFDFLYVNSFFNLYFSIVPVFARFFGLLSAPNIVLAPRGEFSIGAFGIKSWKKVPYTFLVRMLSVYKSFVWHASTNFELDDIYRVMGRSADNIRIAYVASDLSSLESVDYSSSMKSSGAIDSEGSVLRVCFLSRISPMKNLDFAISVLSKVNVPVFFSIYGPKESIDYWSLCEDLLNSLPVNITWLYCGEVKHSDVRSVISKHDLFFVPSRGENYGHVFYEALSAGVPLLVSDRTPWRDLRSIGIGWDISLDQPSDFSDVIESYSQVSNSERSCISRTCIDYAKNKALDKDVLDMNRSLFVCN